MDTASLLFTQMVASITQWSACCCFHSTSESSWHGHINPAASSTAWCTSEEMNHLQVPWGGHLDCFYSFAVQHYCTFLCAPGQLQDKLLEEELMAKSNAHFKTLLETNAIQRLCTNFCTHQQCTRVPDPHTLANTSNYLIFGLVPL